MNNNGHVITAKETNQDLQEYARELFDDYRKRIRAYATLCPEPPQLPAIQEGASQYDKITSLELVGIEAERKIKQSDIPKRSQKAPPVRPNLLVPYSNTLLGLDKARRDARYEMIKIVQEVSEL